MELVKECFSSSDKDKIDELITKISEHVNKTPNFIDKIDQSYFKDKEISDLLCRIALLLNINIPKERFTPFWTTFLKEGIRTDDFSKGFYVISYYFEHYSSVESIAGVESLFSIMFYRIEKSVVEYDFKIIEEPIIKTLASVAQYAPLRCFLSPGLFDSIISLFMNHEESFETSVLFLWRFFHREDASECIDSVVMNLIVCLTNYSPPKPSLWRFLCFFFAKFSAQIEGMCDFDALEEGGLMPIFTRSLIWTVRLVVQHPPEESNEPLFWEMMSDVMIRYSKADSKQPVRRMYDHIFNEVRLAILYSLKTAIAEDHTLIDRNALTTFRVLVSIDEEEVINSFSIMFGEMIDAILSFSLLSENQCVIDHATQFAKENSITINEIVIAD